MSSCAGYFRFTRTLIASCLARSDFSIIIIIILYLHYLDACTYTCTSSTYTTNYDRHSFLFTLRRTNGNDWANICQICPQKSQHFINSRRGAIHMPLLFRNSENVSMVKGNFSRGRSINGGGAIIVEQQLNDLLPAVSSLGMGRTEQNRSASLPHYFTEPSIQFTWVMAN